MTLDPVRLVTGDRDVVRLGHRDLRARAERVPALEVPGDPILVGGGAVGACRRGEDDQRYEERPTHSGNLNTGSRLADSQILARGIVAVVRGANSLLTEGREEVRAAGAEAQLGGQVGRRAFFGERPTGAQQASEQAQATC